MRCFDPTRACPLCKRWDSSEIDRLRDMAGRKTILEIVAALNLEFEGLRPPRNHNAVVIAARRHGIDLVLTSALSIRQVERILHADHRMIRTWIDAGLLVGRQFLAHTHGVQHGPLNRRTCGDLSKSTVTRTTGRLCRPDSGARLPKRLHAVCTGGRSTS